MLLAAAVFVGTALILFGPDQTFTVGGFRQWVELVTFIAGLLVHAWNLVLLSVSGRSHRLAHA